MCGLIEQPGDTGYYETFSIYKKIKINRKVNNNFLFKFFVKNKKFNF